MTLYKLTDAYLRTRGGYQWVPGETRTARRVRGRPRKLCSEDVLHAYRDPVLAMLMDPVHGRFGRSARLWEARGRVAVADPTKVGVVSLTLLREIPLPEVTTEQRITFGILAAWQVCDGPEWRKWARGWLDGSDRSRAAAWAVATAARAADARAAADAAYAARAAAARADAEAAWAADAACDADAAAARAADRAVEADPTLDLVTLAHVAMRGPAAALEWLEVTT